MVRAEIAPERFLAAAPLFKALGAAALARLAAATTRRPLRRGERLFSKGDPVTGMYVVVYGEIRLLSRSPARGERLTGVVSAGRSFGEPVMFLEKPAVVDAEAAVDSLVLHVPKQAVFDEIEASPLFGRRVIAGLSERVETLVKELERQSGGGGRSRLIEYLLHSAAHGTGPAVVVLPAAKSAIASHLNLTPEHFSRVLHELVAQGLLEVQGRRITVPDRERLAASLDPGSRPG